MNELKKYTNIKKLERYLSNNDANILNNNFNEIEIFNDFNDFQSIETFGFIDIDKNKWIRWSLMMELSDTRSKAYISDLAVYGNDIDSDGEYLSEDHLVISSLNINRSLEKLKDILPKIECKHYNLLVYALESMDVYYLDSVIKKNIDMELISDAYRESLKIKDKECHTKLLKSYLDKHELDKLISSSESFSLGL